MYLVHLKLTVPIIDCWGLGKEFAFSAMLMSIELRALFLYDFTHCCPEVPVLYNLRAAVGVMIHLYLKKRTSISYLA